MSDGPGNFRGGKHRGADLVKQRLKQMVIALVHDRDAQAPVARSGGQTMTGGESAEAGADDDDMMRR
jgi:hypothetical protein